MTAHNFPEPMDQRCPICERGILVEMEPKTWDCSRRRCNSQFFHDSDGTLNVRDKPRTSLIERLWKLTRAEASND